MHIVIVQQSMNKVNIDMNNINTPMRLDRGAVEQLNVGGILFSLGMVFELHHHSIVEIFLRRFLACPGSVYFRNIHLMRRNIVHITSHEEYGA